MAEAETAVVVVAWLRFTCVYRRLLLLPRFVICLLFNHTLTAAEWQQQQQQQNEGGRKRKGSEEKPKTRN